MFHSQYGGLSDQSLVVDEDDAWDVSPEDLVFHHGLLLSGKSEEQIDQEHVHPSIEDSCDRLIDMPVVLELVLKESLL